MQQQPDSSQNAMVPSATNASGENMERLRFVEHRGKRILLADVSACTEEQFLECIRSVPQYVT